MENDKVRRFLEHGVCCIKPTSRNDVWPGNASVCDPKQFYECLKPTQIEYVRNDEQTKCNCPRQCCRLTYDYTVSQAEFSDFFIQFAKDFYQMNQSTDAIKYDYCLLEVI